MAVNNSYQAVDGKSSMRLIGPRVIIVQVLIAIYLYINFLLILTFSKKDFLHTNMRYIFFANTLLSDSLFLILSDVLLILSYFGIPMQMWLCLLLYIVLSVNTFVTPLTLTAMTLERYVAICMPLRHGELCTPHFALCSILILHAISYVPGSVIVSNFIATVSSHVYTQAKVCSVEMFIIHKWQGHFRSAVHQSYFLFMSSTIAFCYIKIMKVATNASGENKKSLRKGVQTVVLHAFQLLLSLAQLWCPFIESAVLQIDFVLFVNVRYFNYIAFILSPRCLSPLIYGLRDEKFFLALKYYALFGLYRNNSPGFVR
ncbi:odorant receptor 131-2-like [Lampris incognitus]|uniref:odorant receptor 131-2-like n=1 Tax=Lampris incognitus TaxID=2546036 RepID=UPI0024B510DA|nr:odorant receptor 131-2-like [Lampris incognitus]